MTARQLYFLLKPHLQRHGDIEVRLLMGGLEAEIGDLMPSSGKAFFSSPVLMVVAKKRRIE